MRAARLQCLLPCTLPLPHQQPRRLCRIVIAKRLQGSNAHVVGAPPTSRYLYDGCGVTPLLANRIGNNHRGHAAGTTTAMTAAVGCPGRANFSTESSLLVSTKKSRWVGVASAAGLAAVVAIYQVIYLFFNKQNWTDNFCISMVCVLYSLDLLCWIADSHFWSTTRQTTSAVTN